MANDNANPSVNSDAGGTDRRVALKLFAISFAALFLELMVIRWVPSVVRIVAYYSNLMLISSFLGLGLGAMLARRQRNLLPIFPVLLAIDLLLMLLCRHLIGFPTRESEQRFGEGGVVFFTGASVAGVFILNAAVFIPLGQAIGRLFRRQPPLRAYTFDLIGSLCGTVGFGFFSLTHFSPVLGLILVAAIFLWVSGPRWRWINAVLLTAVITTVGLSAERGAMWSPYYYVTVHPMNAQTPAMSDPPPNLREMVNPLLFTVCVNNYFYQYHGTINPIRYIPGTKLGDYVINALDTEYFLPYVLHPTADRVCVVGAGGGTDVEAAILKEAGKDAVEIDPVLVSLSRRFNASDIYDDPRVSIHINDARAFFQSSSGGYDLVVFGLLDSQAVFSYSSNIRLDGDIYTVQSIRKAYSLLKPDGMLSITFLVARSWLADKLKAMVREAIGRDPIVYRDQGQYILLAPRDDNVAAPPTVGQFSLDGSKPGAVDLPTDDWPYLYLSRRTIPNDYLMIIGVLLASSVLGVLALRWTDPMILGGGKISSIEGHFFFLGAGFLLLETKSIGDCSLYFGTTWFVTMVVVSGVLLMVLAANLLAMKLTRPSFWFYLPLIATLIGLYLVPRDQILGLPYAWRLLWALLIVPLPIFFAGLIFSTTFRQGTDPAILLGANLIGATIGGFLEYAGMVLGTRSLSLFVIAAYLASMDCLILSRRFVIETPPTLVS
jgi:hypothetical protein